MSGADSDADFWDARYRSRPSLWSGEPNPQLVAEADALEPGSALDVGCGEGADSVWLAQRGWRVTATDISVVALDRARVHAREQGPDIGNRISFVAGDILAIALPAACYDLVSAHFVQLASPKRELFFRRLAAAVNPGGTLLIVAHHISDLDTEAGRPPMREVYYSPEDVIGSLEASQWQVLVSEARPREIFGSAGQSITVHDTIVRAKRR
jgi:ubiquinone/menaquinone biosynthesis C-methylase UbiE